MPPCILRPGNEKQNLVICEYSENLYRKLISVKTVSTAGFCVLCTFIAADKTAFAKSALKRM